MNERANDVLTSAESDGCLGAGDRLRLAVLEAPASVSEGFSAGGGGREAGLAGTWTRSAFWLMWAQLDAWHSGWRVGLWLVTLLPAGSRSCGYCAPRMGRPWYSVKSS